jgi:hypothetical protein
MQKDQKKNDIRVKNVKIIYVTPCIEHGVAEFGFKKVLDFIVPSRGICSEDLW